MSTNFRDFIDISHLLWCASPVQIATVDARAVLIEQGRRFDVHEPSRRRRHEVAGATAAGEATSWI
jgi:hypothetical protein